MPHRALGRRSCQPCQPAPAGSPSTSSAPGLACSCSPPAPMTATTGTACGRRSPSASARSPWTGPATVTPRCRRRPRARRPRCSPTRSRTSSTRWTWHRWRWWATRSAASPPRDWPSAGRRRSAPWSWSTAAASPDRPCARAFCAAMSRPWFLRAIYPWFAARYLHARDGAALRIRDAAIDAARRPGTTEILNGLWRSFSGPEHDLRAGAGGISAPTLLVWGVHDPVVPPRLGRRAAATIPGARLIVLDAGHVPFADRPEAFLATVLPFLEPTRRRAPHRSEEDG